MEKEVQVKLIAVAVSVILFITFSIIAYNIFISPEIKKSIENSLCSQNQSGQAYVYKVTLNPKNWFVKDIGYYGVKDDEKLKNLEEDKDKKPKYTLKINKGPSEFTGNFVIEDSQIEEDFNESGVFFSSLSNILKDEVSVFVKVDCIIAKDFTLSILDPAKEPIKESNFSIVNIGNDSYVSDGTLVGLRKIKTLEDEFPLFSEGCSELVEVIPNVNKLGKNRINLVFIGIGYERELDAFTKTRIGSPEFVKYINNLIDYSGNGLSYLDVNNNPSIKKGLFGEEPFKSNKHLFNLWYSERLIDFNNPSENSCRKIIGDDRFKPCQGLANLYPIYLVNKDCRSSAIIGGEPFISFPLDPDKTGKNIDTSAIAYYRYPRTLLHEFGHSIGSLADEYVESSLGNKARLPNCVESQAEAEKQGWKEAYPGCAYISSNLRPSANSIMKDPHSNTNFEKVNENYLCSQFAILTGNEICGVCGTCRELEIKDACTSSLECTSGNCIDGKCVPNTIVPECTSDSECNADQKCENNRCINIPPRCTKNCASCLQLGGMLCPNQNCVNGNISSETYETNCCIPSSANNPVGCSESRYISALGEPLTFTRMCLDKETAQITVSDNSGIITDQTRLQVIGLDSSTKTQEDLTCSGFEVLVDNAEDIPSYSFISLLLSLILIILFYYKNSYSNL
ncbi:hypothetical protein J4216_06405 [Candidatus Woesearchaeota archaeon]|nr:hypothetical protein [Candidatus Woesearchaeota archaeon]